MQPTQTNANPSKGGAHNPYAQGNRTQPTKQTILSAPNPIQLEARSTAIQSMNLLYCRSQFHPETFAIELTSNRLHIARGNILIPVSATIIHSSHLNGHIYYIITLNDTSGAKYLLTIEPVSEPVQLAVFPQIISPVLQTSLL